MFLREVQFDAASIKALVAPPVLIAGGTPAVSKERANDSDGMWLTIRPSHSRLAGPAPPACHARRLAVESNPDALPATK